MTALDDPTASDQPAPESTRRLLHQAREILTVERLVGAPVDRDGTTVIPVVSIRGGGGAGGGSGADEHGSEGGGEGLGFGMSGRPVGAYVIKDGDVSWQPALDVTRFLVAGTLTAVAYFCFAWLTARARRR